VKEVLHKNCRKNGAYILCVTEFPASSAAFEITE
jgi:hypothetical protein